jgi:hypothetical protein
MATRRVNLLLYFMTNFLAMHVSVECDGACEPAVGFKVLFRNLYSGSVVENRNCNQVIRKHV